MGIVTKLTPAEAPRDYNALMGHGSFVLKKLAEDIGFKAEAEKWSAFIALPKEKQVEAILATLKQIDAVQGAPSNGTVHGVATPAPAAAAPAQPEAAAAAPAAEAAADKPKRTPRHNGAKAAAAAPAQPAAEQAAPTAPPNAGTGDLVTKGPTGGDFLILSAAFEELKRSVETANGNVRTLITNIPGGDVFKQMMGELTALRAELALVQQTQVGMARLLLSIAEGVFQDRDAALSNAEDETGLDKIVARPGKR